ncbi:histidine kinase [Paenibacillus sp. LHD-117]|uniref:sensor histidine kinase n=1 Tax=Paenibacillus sp. LHD-117 TaxID=3071412 RepID=UPI0027E08389|nr:histidine kinase [Paenibacillus sp. LHD-117]MDQ6418452.1 histidine kinase [Paenibacillus sp. LHD-117]
MLTAMKDFLLQVAMVATLVYTYQIFFAERYERKQHVKLILTVLLGLSILFCMTFPAYVNAQFRIDIRIVPLLLGALYGGWRTGLFLCALIILYRVYLGVDTGLITTVLALAFSMPVIVYFQKIFTRALKRKRIFITLGLSSYYCLVGLISAISIRGFSFQVLQVQIIHISLAVSAVLFFTLLNETIQDILRKNRQLQSEAKEAEIAFLRSQIKPHFLYNALNSIASLCIDEPRKAEQLTLDLSHYLRGSFDFKHLESLTTLGKELELIEAYINIEKARFGNRLQVEYDVDANPQTRMPPLILQPLVENAIRHGLMSNLRGGTVKIAAKMTAADTVSFAVEDNGSGMSDATRAGLLKPDVDKKGIGLWNISQRIELLYGKRLHIESAEGIGTKVYFEIPDRQLQRAGG